MNNNHFFNCGSSTFLIATSSFQFILHVEMSFNLCFSVHVKCRGYFSDELESNFLPNIFFFVIIHVN